MLDGGATAETVVERRVADWPDIPDAARVAELRAELGLPCDAESPALIAGDGASLTAADLPMWLRRAKLVSLSLEANGGMCRDLLRTRYGNTDPLKEVAP
jgi:hypothetical protein